MIMNYIKGNWVYASQYEVGVFQIVTVQEHPTHTRYYNTPGGWVERIDRYATPEEIIKAGGTPVNQQITNNYELY